MSRDREDEVQQGNNPPGIFVMLAAQLKTDYRLGLKFLLLLNLNFALINLLPLPVLDGWHIVAAVVGRIPIGPKTVEWTTTAFAVLLICVMLLLSSKGWN